MPDSPNQDRVVVRVLFYEMQEGDWRKLQGRSNVTESGGGARDLRLSDRAFRDMMAKFFPQQRQTRVARADRNAAPDPITNRHPRIQETITIQHGPLTWVEGNEEKTQDVEYWPPTGARPSEGRLAQISKIPPLRDRRPPATEGRAFLVLLQDAHGQVFPYYLTEAYLRRLRGTAQAIWSGAVEACIDRADQAARAGRVVRRITGYVDNVSASNQREYCHE